MAMMTILCCGSGGCSDAHPTGTGDIVRYSIEVNYLTRACFSYQIGPLLFGASYLHHYTVPASTAHFRDTFVPTSDAEVGRGQRGSFDAHLPPTRR